ncbi:MAG: hypothetical protein RQ750_12245 [Roseovarius sp.]|nr:hypothetical protein [Roseovarius sp.]
MANTGTTSIVSGDIETPGAVSAVGGTVEFELNRWDVETGQIIVPTIQTAVVASDGTISIALWRSALGERNSWYNVTWVSASALKRVMLGPIVVPDAATADLNTLLATFAQNEDLDAALIAQAQASAAEAAASAATAASEASIASAESTQAVLAARASGAPVVTMLTSPTPANGTIEILLATAGSQVWEVIAGVWSFAGWLDILQFPTRAAMVSAGVDLGAVTNGMTIFAEGLGYLRDSASTAIPDFPGWKPIGTVTPEHFGALGDGSDETAKVQAALDAAAGGKLVFGAGKTYGYTNLTIPQGVTIRRNGATLDRITASTAHGVVIEGDAEIDGLVITTPGGLGGDKAVAIRGSNVHIGFMSVIAAVEGDHTVSNWAVEIGSSPAGAALSRITIDQFFCRNFTTAVFAKQASLISINNALVEFYRLAFFLRDVARSTFDNVACRFIGAAVNGAAGENGLLLESSVASGSTSQLSFTNWHVSDSGEHAYRLGGQLAIKDVSFENCTATRPGSSILTGDLSSGEWHGGCGFKILGGASTTTEFHENISFENCSVIDTNVTYGTYPAGHGVNNFTPWLIMMAKNVRLSNCWMKAVDQSIVARNGVLFTAVDGLTFDACSFRDTESVAIKPFEETPVAGSPGTDYPIKNLTVNGGFFEVVDTTPGNGIVMYMSDAATYAHENWTVRGAVFRGGTSAVRVETVGAGSFANIDLEYTYIDSIVDDQTFVSPSAIGGGIGNVRVSAVAPWRPAAGFPAVKNGSTWTSPNDGEVRTKSDGVWRRGPKTYTVVIATDDVATIIPPAADVGVIFVAGNGLAEHVFGWYRATSSPRATKYGGAAAVNMVATALTGTTGAPGSVTVGIQNNLIYIENRTAAANTFRVSFLMGL